MYCPKRDKLAGLGYSYPPQPILSPRRRLYEPEAILKNEAKGPFPILSGFIFAALLGSEAVISLRIKPPRHPVLAGERWPFFYK